MTHIHAFFDDRVEGESMPEVGGQGSVQRERTSAGGCAVTMLWPQVVGVVPQQDEAVVAVRHENPPWGPCTPFL